MLSFQGRVCEGINHNNPSIPFFNGMQYIIELIQPYLSSRSRLLMIDHVGSSISTGGLYMINSVESMVGDLS